MQEIRQHIWQKYIDDDVMTWGCSHKGPVMWNFDLSFIVRLIKLNKQSSCRWLDIPLCLCDVTLLLELQLSPVSSTRIFW